MTSLKIYGSIGAAVLCFVVSGCKKDPIKLTCKSTQVGDNVAFEFNEEEQSARRLEPITLEPQSGSYFTSVSITPTVVTMDVYSGGYWYLDRTNGKLSIKSPNRSLDDYYCSSGRLF